MGAFAEMSEDVNRICDIIAHDLARTHFSYYNDDAKRTKGMYRKRIQKAWGQTAHRGWARLLLDCARDLIIHGLAHHGANGVAMPTDKDDQDGHFFYNHPSTPLHPAALASVPYGIVLVRSSSSSSVPQGDPKAASLPYPFPSRK